MKLAIPGAYALLLLDLVKRWQITDEEMLEGCPFTREQLTAPATRVAPDAFRELILRAHELTGESGLAVYVGLQMRVSSHGFLGFAAMTAPTVGDALLLVERFAATRFAAIGLSVHAEGATASLVLEEHARLATEERDFIVILLFVGLVHLAEALTGQPLEGGAEVTFAKPGYYDRLAHLIPASVRFIRFEQPTNRLVFDRAILALPLTTADSAAAQLARAQCERELASLGDGDRTRDRVRELLPASASGFRTIEEIARELHVSTRTLKRRLAAAGTTFSDLLDELRRERALQLVGDHKLTLDEIADRLGYSDVANFTRAFRRWTGTTPAALRKR